MTSENYYKALGQIVQLTQEKVAAEKALAQSEEANAALRAEIHTLKATINTPHTDEWFEAVRLEGAHQINRWGTNSDEGKTPSDWFWLVGYLAGKALAASLGGNIDKAKHHTISTGAALLNWFRTLTGDTVSMRPGHADGINSGVSGEPKGCAGGEL